MAHILHSKKIAKPDFPPRMEEEAFEKQGDVLVLAVIALCCIAGTIAILLLIV
ncbi:MAG: hypothetical protein ACE5HC_15335 [Candidatus Binatia bacterium]